MRNLFCYLSLITVFAICSNPASAQEVAESTPAQHAATIDGLLKKYQEYGQLNGAVLVAEEGKVILSKGYGMANMEWEVPIESNTKFRIGSVTKQFTAAAILLLVEEGKIKLDDPITEYLKDYRKDTGDKVTVHQLLCHTSGIPSYTTGEFFEKHCRTHFEIDEFVTRFASGDLQFEPGSEFRYNNSGYHLLGVIIEKVTGESYADVIKKRIFDPVGMTDSGYDKTGDVIKNRAQGYDKNSNGYVNADYLDMDIPYSAGSLYSTVDDLFKWDLALHNNSVLTAESLKLMETPNLDGYGYGVSLDDATIGDSKLKIVQHGGGIHGFNCQFSRAVNKKHLFVVLDNVGLGKHHAEINSNVFRILEDQPVRQPKRAIYDELAKVAFGDGGAEAAVAKYRSLKASSPEGYDFANEESLNTLGYELMGRDNVSGAIEVLKLNVEMFPESSNPYDSLGEAYLKAGNEELGLKNYKKSVELNPENLAAVQITKRLEGEETSVPPEVLESYIGTYIAAEEGFTVEITVEGGDLIGKPVGQDAVILQPVSKTEFVVAKLNAQVKFVSNDAGKVTAIEIVQRENSLVAKKTE